MKPPRTTPPAGRPGTAADVEGSPRGETLELGNKCSSHQRLSNNAGYSLLPNAYVGCPGVGQCIYSRQCCTGELMERETESEKTNLPQWHVKISSDLWFGKHRGKNGFG